MSLLGVLMSVGDVLCGTQHSGIGPAVFLEQDQ